jgi:pSer/pThr/pTyr-binding forkhead associated (FHA) protein
MENLFQINTPQWYWYAYWLPVAAAGIAIVHSAVVWGTTKMDLYGSFLRIISAMALVASIPLAAMRLDFTVSGNIYVMLFMSYGSPIAVMLLMFFHSMVLGKKSGYEKISRKVYNTINPIKSRERMPDTDSNEYDYQENNNETIVDDYRNNQQHSSGNYYETTVSEHEQDNSSDYETIVSRPHKRLPAWVAVEKGENTGDVCNLGEKISSIGRSSENDLVLSDPSVSRNHAFITKNADEFEIVDNGSATGISINGSRLFGEKVPTGGTIKIGETELMVIPVQANRNNPLRFSDNSETIVSPKTSNFLLLVKAGPDAGSQFTLSEGLHVIGRSSTCDLVVSDSSVSREHAMIKVSGDKITISDSGSTTGTYVDGREVKGRRLFNKDKIKIGDSTLVFFKAFGV